MTNPFLTQDQQIVGDIFTSTEPLDNLITLCDDFGSRFVAGCVKSKSTPGMLVDCHGIATKRKCSNLDFCVFRCYNTNDFSRRLYT